MLTYEERIAMIKAAEQRVAERKCLAESFGPCMDRPLLIDEPDLPSKWQERIKINRFCNRPTLDGIQTD
jgi:hypothetical protein